MKNKFKHFLLLSIVVFLSGCIQVNSQKELGGVFISDNKAESWHHKVYAGTNSNNKNITLADTSVYDLDFHPTDKDKLYIVSKTKGVFFSNNAGDAWQYRGLSNKNIKFISLNQKQPDELYVASAKNIFKTIDNGDNWDLIYTENRNDVNIRGLVVDAYLPERVYIILSNGEFVKSPNRGRSWTVEKKFEYELVKLLIDPRDTRKIFIFTKKDGFYKTNNLGKTWQKVNEELKDFKYAYDVADVIFDYTRPDSLIYASKNGLLKTINGGKNFERLPLLTQPGEAKIYTLVQNPLNNKEIYYTTDKGIYKTLDGGDSWITKNLPSDMIPKVLRINNQSPNILYLGVQESTKKQGGLF